MSVFRTITYGLNPVMLHGRIVRREPISFRIKEGHVIVTDLVIRRPNLTIEDLRALDRIPGHTWTVTADIIGHDTLDGYEESSFTRAIFNYSETAFGTIYLYDGTPPSGKKAEALLGDWFPFLQA